jgi:tight adherence protein B
MLWISLILLALALLFSQSSKKSKLDQFFQIDNQGAKSVSAINIHSLSQKHKWRKWKESMSPTLMMLGPRSTLYIALYAIGATIASWYVLVVYLHQNNPLLICAAVAAFLVIGYRFLLSRRRADFENSFPDALNILMSAVTAGDSLMQAISYVGNTMDNAIGREFKLMADRLKIGETPEAVLMRSCKNYPYPEFLFFTITLRANISRGGQLKGVLARLIRVLVDSRTLEKKKMAMTSEARISAKIVAAIPLAFTLLLNYINPGNVEFVLYDPDGRVILYYVLISEMIGLTIIWLLVRGVKA